MLKFILTFCVILHVSIFEENLCKTKAQTRLGDWASNICNLSLKDYSITIPFRKLLHLIFELSQSADSYLLHDGNRLEEAESLSSF